VAPADGGIKKMKQIFCNRAFYSVPIIAGFLFIGAQSAISADIAPEAVVVENLAIAESLTGADGNVEEGKKIFANRKLGNCLACHANADMADQPFHGEVGPALDGVASRWQVPQLRTIVVNAKKVFTKETVMPAFYSLEVGEDVRKDLIGKTILSAQQIEDLVAYLATLK